VLEAMIQRAPAATLCGRIDTHDTTESSIDRVCDVLAASIPFWNHRTFLPLNCRVTADSAARRYPTGSTMRIEISPWKPSRDRSGGPGSVALMGRGEKAADQAAVDAMRSASTAWRSTARCDREGERDEAADALYPANG